MKYEHIQDSQYYIMNCKQNEFEDRTNYKYIYVFSTCETSMPTVKITIEIQYDSENM